MSLSVKDVKEKVDAEIGVIEGNGIGLELIRATKHVLSSTDEEIEWGDVQVGDSAFEAYGHPLPPESVRRLKEIGILLKGPIAVERSKGRVTCEHEDAIALNEFGGFQYPEIALSKLPSSW